MLETYGKSPFFAKGLKFSCLRCSYCCRYESGYVFLSLEDTSRLEAALNIDHQDLIKTYCRWIPSYKGTKKLSLKETSKYDCIFWSGDAAEGGGCSVYQARPLQCRAFPFWQSIMLSPAAWKTASKDCPGINRGELVAPDAIKGWLKLREAEPVITKGNAIPKGDV